MATAPHLPSAAKKNIEIIARVEQQLLHRRTHTERVGEAVARFFGSLYFIAAHAAFLTLWILLNSPRISAIQPFDPYPFSLLAFVITIEFNLLTMFVLINQKHQIRHSEEWSQLHLQLSMLTEQEVTKNMQMLATICQRMGLEKVEGDAELSQLAQATSVPEVVTELERSRKVATKDGKQLTPAPELER